MQTPIPLGPTTVPIETPNVKVVSTQPSSNPSWDSFALAFSGPNPGVSFGSKASVTGSTTLGQPSSGYSLWPGMSQITTYLDNQSGWNESTSTNDGRTGIAGMRSQVWQRGQGDAFSFHAAGFVNSTKASATHFLANPAVALFAGNASAGANGVYLNVREILMQDNGYDVAAIGDVVNFHRTNDTGALSTVWFGYRPQSKETTPIDAFYSMSGTSKIGVDFTQATLNTSGTWTQAAITLKRDQRIYFDAAAPSGSPGFTGNTGTTYLASATSISGGLLFAVNNTAVFQLTSSQVTANTTFVGTGRMEWTPRASVSLSTNGRFEIEATSNTSVTLVYRGSDGTTRRSSPITLS